MSDETGWAAKARRKCGNHVTDGQKIGKTDARPLLELWLSGGAASVPGARRQAMQACAQAGINDDDCAALDLALGEALANAVVHGAARCDSSSRAVQVSLWNYQQNLVIEICDGGPGFEPPAPPYEMPPADDEATHGRGLPLMQRLTDAFVVCRGDVHAGGAVIYLVKSLPPCC